MEKKIVSIISENLQREISHLKQEIQRAELEQQRHSACSTAFRR